MADLEDAERLHYLKMFASPHLFFKDNNCNYVGGLDIILSLATWSLLHKERIVLSHSFDIVQDITEAGPHALYATPFMT